VRHFAIGVLLLFAMALARNEYALPSDSPSPTFLYTVGQRYEPLAWMDGGERFAAGATIFVRDANGQHPLVPSFAASADPAVSFDGSRVLFAGKRTSQDRWQIWEMALESGDPRRITNCAEGCVRPLYLPEDRIVYGEQIGGRIVIQAAALGGGKPLPLTYGPASSLPTDVLQDGRVLFETSFPSGGSAIPELYTVYSDGSGVESYRCDHGKARYSGKQVSSGDIVFATQGGLARFTSALAKQVQLAAADGEYAGDIAETGSGEWLLAWRPNRSSPFQLMWWKPCQLTLRPALQERGLNVVQPVLVTKRAVPKRHPSGLHDWSVANLLCLNAYTSKYKFATSSIQSVRIYTTDASGAVLLLGSAPVEPDGSFFAQVPGDQPLQIELLDGQNKTLKREAGWFWMRSGEQRACVGCHAGPETAPENAVPMILLKSTTPADMTHPAMQSSGGH
jgi:hydrazine synthase alpha subunit-like protein